MDFEIARFNMVEQQVRPWDVLDARVLNTIGNIPRERFVPAEYQNLAYADSRIPLNEHTRMLNPNIIGRMLQHLQVQPDDLVLEIGTGSGYLTACLATLGRHVDSVEIDADLADTARDNLENLGYENVTISEGDATHGWEQKRFYNVIVFTGSMPDIPEHYKELLHVGGRMFIVTGEQPIMTAQLVTRIDKNSWEVEDLFETAIDRLTGSEETPEEKFVF